MPFFYSINDDGCRHKLLYDPDSSLHDTGLMIDYIKGFSSPGHVVEGLSGRKKDTLLILLPATEVLPGASVVTEHGKQYFSREGRAHLVKVCSQGASLTYQEDDEEVKIRFDYEKPSKNPTNRRLKVVKIASRTL